MSKQQYSLEHLVYLMQRLRDPETGCPWDIKQTFTSIQKDTIEETYELVDALNSGDRQQIQEELGDVLFQVVFYSQMASEEQSFSLSDVVDGLTSKLIRRHPHVFPDGDLHAFHDADVDVEQVLVNWEKMKKAERAGKEQHGVLDDVPKALPALSRAQKMQKRVSQHGFDWPDAASALAKIKEEVTELEEAIQSGEKPSIQSELGDLIFSVVNVARHLGVDSETALAGTNSKFENRFRFIEEALADKGQTVDDATLIEMDALWEVAKKNEA